MIAYLLLKTSRNLKTSLDRKLKEFGITSTQFAVMNQIDIMDDNPLAWEIASAIGSDRPTISAVIHRLFLAGLIHKIENPSDRRSQYLQLSEKGIVTLKQLRIIADDLSQDIFGHLSEQDKENFIKELNTINEIIGENND